MMKSNKKFLIATGGTGGHVFPAYSLAQHFSDNNFQIELINFLFLYSILNIA